jgi:hypothetical protein
MAEDAIYIVSVRQPEPGLFEASVFRPRDHAEIDALWVESGAVLEQGRTAWDAARDALAAAMPEPASP